MTALVLALVAAALIVFDVWLAVRRPGQTISEVINRGSKARPIIAFALGVLVGHWFWPL